MLLAIDIGNTAVSTAIIKKTRIVARYHLDTFRHADSSPKALNQFLLKIGKAHRGLTQVMVCSVVPHFNHTMAKLVSKNLGLKTIFIGQDLMVPIKNNYYNPKQVGQDRLVGAYAAKMLYGAPCIVIDFGTAITFDVVSVKGAYEGGIIIPGIRLSAESLFQKTALLPRVESIKAPRQLIGKDTKESILSGLFFGYGAMSCGLIDLISQRLKRKANVIITGGYTHMMKKFVINKVDTIDNDLIFKGLALLSSQL